MPSPNLTLHHNWTESASSGHCQCLFRGLCSCPAVDDSAWALEVMVSLRWCPLRHSSLRTFLYDCSNGKMLGTKNVWSRMIQKKTFTELWCSITRRGHIQSQYLQIDPMIWTLLWGIGTFFYLLRLHTDRQQCAGGGKIKVWGHYTVPLDDPMTQLFR